MIIAVTGITGHTGKFFLKELENHKFEGIVRCLVRENSDTECLDKSPLRIEKIVGGGGRIQNAIETYKRSRCYHAYFQYSLFA